MEKNVENVRFVLLLYCENKALSRILFIARRIPLRMTELIALRGCLRATRLLISRRHDGLRANTLSSAEDFEQDDIEGRQQEVAQRSTCDKGIRSMVDVTI
jgi:hypothetical protein